MGEKNYIPDLLKFNQWAATDAEFQALDPAEQARVRLAAVGAPSPEVIFKSSNFANLPDQVTKTQIFNSFAGVDPEFNQLPLHDKQVIRDAVVGGPPEGHWQAPEQPPAQPALPQLPEQPQDSFWAGNFNTKLTGEEEQRFQQWVNAESQRQGRDLRMDLPTYDLRGFWKAGEKTDQYGHGTDKYKKPSHPTFSSDSIYARGPYHGGHWDEDGTFHPSDTNLKLVGPQQIEEYVNWAGQGRERVGAPLAQGYQVGTQEAAAARAREAQYEPPPAGGLPGLIEKTVGKISDLAQRGLNDLPTPMEAAAGALGGMGQGFLELPYLTSLVAGKLIPGQDPFDKSAEFYQGATEKYAQLGQQSKLGEFAGQLVPFAILASTGVYGPQGTEAGASFLSRVGLGARTGAALGDVEAAKQILENPPKDMVEGLERTAGTIALSTVEVAGLSAAHAALMPLAKAMAGGLEYTLTGGKIWSNIFNPERKRPMTMEEWQTLYNMTNPDHQVVILDERMAEALRKEGYDAEAGQVVKVPRVPYGQPENPPLTPEQQAQGRQILEQHAAEEEAGSMAARGEDVARRRYEQEEAARRNAEARQAALEEAARVEAAYRERAIPEPPVADRVASLPEDQQIDVRDRAEAIFQQQMTEAIQTYGMDRINEPQLQEIKTRAMEEALAEVQQERAVPEPRRVVQPNEPGPSRLVEPGPAARLEQAEERVRIANEQARAQQTIEQRAARQEAMMRGETPRVTMPGQEMRAQQPVEIQWQPRTPRSTTVRGTMMRGGEKGLNVTLTKEGPGSNAWSVNINGERLDGGLRVEQARRRAAELAQDHWIPAGGERMPELAPPEARPTHADVVEVAKNLRRKTIADAKAGYDVELPDGGVTLSMDRGKYVAEWYDLNDQPAGRNTYGTLTEVKAALLDRAPLEQPKATEAPRTPIEMPEGPGQVRTEGEFAAEDRAAGAEKAAMERAVGRGEAEVPAGEEIPTVTLRKPSEFERSHSPTPQPVEPGTAAVYAAYPHVETLHVRERAEARRLYVIEEQNRIKEARALVDGPNPDLQRFEELTADVGFIQLQLDKIDDPAKYLPSNFYREENVRNPEERDGAVAAAGRIISMVAQAENTAEAHAVERGRAARRRVSDEMSKEGAKVLVGTELGDKPHEAFSRLAAVGEILRNPEVELSHIVLVNDRGVIMDTTTVSSRMPDSTSWFPRRTHKGGQRMSGAEMGADVDMQAKKTIKYLQNLMRRVGATGYYMVHNHPGASPRPSIPDATVSAQLASHLPGYRGDIILNDKEWVFLDANAVERILQFGNRNTVEILKKTWPERAIEPKGSPDVRPLTGLPARKADDVAAIADQLLLSPEARADRAWVVFGTNGETMAVMPLSKNSLASLGKVEGIKGTLLGIKRQLGADTAFMIVPDTDYVDPNNNSLMMALHNLYRTEAIDEGVLSRPLPDGGRTQEILGDSLLTWSKRYGNYPPPIGGDVAHGRERFSFGAYRLSKPKVPSERAEAARKEAAMRRTPQELANVPKNIDDLEPLENIRRRGFWDRMKAARVFREKPEEWESPKLLDLRRLFRNKFRAFRGITDPKLREIAEDYQKDMSAVPMRGKALGKRFNNIIDAMSKGRDVTKMERAFSMVIDGEMSLEELQHRLDLEDNHPVLDVLRQYQAHKEKLQETLANHEGLSEESRNTILENLYYNTRFYQFHLTRNSFIPNKADFNRAVRVYEQGLVDEIHAVVNRANTLNPQGVKAPRIDIAHYLETGDSTLLAGQSPSRTAALEAVRRHYLDVADLVDSIASQGDVAVPLENLEAIHQASVDAVNYHLLEPGGRIPAKGGVDVSNLQKRVLTNVFRSLYGEVMTAPEKVAKTYETQQNMILRQVVMGRIWEEGEGIWWGRKSPKFRVHLENDPERYDGLADKYVLPEIADFFEAGPKPTRLRQLYSKAWLGPLGTTRAIHLLGIKTIGRNGLTSLLGQALACGDLQRPEFHKHYTEGMRIAGLAAEEMFKEAANPHRRGGLVEPYEQMAKASEEGWWSSSSPSIIQGLRATLEGMEFKGKGAKNAKNRLSNLMVAYGMIDFPAKYASYHAHYDIYRAAGLSEEKAAKAARDWVRDNYQNADRLPEAVNMLTRLGFADYLGYQYDAPRFTVNALKYAVRDLFKGDPHTGKRSVTTMMGFAAGRFVPLFALGGGNWLAATVFRKPLTSAWVGAKQFLDEHAIQPVENSIRYLMGYDQKNEDQPAKIIPLVGAEAAAVRTLQPTYDQNAMQLSWRMVMPDGSVKIAYTVLSGNTAFPTEELFGAALQRYLEDGTPVWKTISKNVVEQLGPGMLIEAWEKFLFGIDPTYRYKDEGALEALHWWKEGLADVNFKEITGKRVLEFILDVYGGPYDTTLRGMMQLWKARTEGQEPQPGSYTKLPTAGDLVRRAARLIRTSVMDSDEVKNRLYRISRRYITIIQQAKGLISESDSEELKMGKASTEALGKYVTGQQELLKARRRLHGVVQNVKALMGDAISNDELAAVLQAAAQAEHKALGSDEALAIVTGKFDPLSDWEHTSRPNLEQRGVPFLIDYMNNPPPSGVDFGWLYQQMKDRGYELPERSKFPAVARRLYRDWKKRQRRFGED